MNPLHRIRAALSALVRPHPRERCIRVEELFTHIPRQRVFLVLFTDGYITHVDWKALGIPRMGEQWPSTHRVPEGVDKTRLCVTAVHVEPHDVGTIKIVVNYGIRVPPTGCTDPTPPTIYPTLRA